MELLRVVKIEINETIDIRLFKRAIEIATDNGRCNKGYVNGIIKQWMRKKHKRLLKI
ncbi:DnaD domain protein [Paraclostridium bifermentans]|nr:DnaD domain protein [Paraclostridium bifermentans]